MDNELEYYKRCTRHLKFTFKVLIIITSIFTIGITLYNMLIEGREFQDSAFFLMLAPTSFFLSYLFLHEMSNGTLLTKKSRFTTQPK